jgi:hypothetical protein
MRKKKLIKYAWSIVIKNESSICADPEALSGDI